MNRSRAARAENVYCTIKEDWGLRRFYFRDPAGNLVNVVDSYLHGNLRDPDGHRLTFAK